MQNRIRELREERGMNQDALAGLVGVSQQKISKVERNTESLGIDLLIEISDYFGVTTDYLLCLSDEKRGTAQDRRVRRKMDEHAALIAAYEALNEENRRMARKMMTVMKRLQDEEMRSHLWSNSSFFYCSSYKKLNFETAVLRDPSHNDRDRSAEKQERFHSLLHEVLR